MTIFSKLKELIKPKNMEETTVTDTIETEVSTPEVVTEEATEAVEEVAMEDKENYQPYVEPSVEERNLEE